MRTRTRRFGKRSPAGTLTLCLAGSILFGAAACTPQTVYVKGDSQTLPVKAGQPAPGDGWVVSDQAMADLLECCQGCLNEQGSRVR